MLRPPANCPCGAPSHITAPLRRCTATCCQPDGGSWHCPTCWPEHDAQQFLESHGVTELDAGDFGHHEILRLMVLYRQER